jgi:hypothetical protein
MHKYRIAILHRDARDGEAAAFTDAEHVVDAYREELAEEKGRG